MLGTRPPIHLTQGMVAAAVNLDSFRLVSSGSEFGMDLKGYLLMGLKFS